MRGLLATILLAGAAQVAPPSPPPSRDAAPTGTAIVRGRVTDAESGRPLARVMVMLVPTALLALGDNAAPKPAGVRHEPRTTLTGADGRFEYKELPAGAYYVMFEPSELRGSHLRQDFGETGRANEINPSKPPTLELKDGEVRGDINVSLARSLAVEGRVVDEVGDPLSNVQVSAHPWDGPGQAYMGLPRFTDDRGAFRVFGLQPGQYRICAKPELHFGPTEDTRERLIATCYPAAIAESAAEPVIVGSTDVVGIDIRLQRTRAYKITGMAVDSSGAPVERAHVNLVTVGKMSSSSNEVTVLPGGQFRALSVTPGEYAIHVEIGSRYNPEDKRERELGQVPIRVENADVEGIVVTTAKLAKVAGRIVFDDGAPEGQIAKIRITAGMMRSAASYGMMIGGPWPSAEVGDDLTFELTGLFGPQTISVVGQPRGWVVKTVKYRGDDVTDLPVEFKPSSDPRAREVILTRQAAVVSGRVLDDDGKPVEEGFVMLLPADAARRRAGFGAKSVVVKPGGAFSLAPVRAGEYIIAAIVGPPMSMMSLPFDDGSDEKLERVATLGERMLLVENEQRTIDLRAVKPQ